MSTYRKEWPCCDLVTETDSYEPDKCPECAMKDLEKALRQIEKYVEYYNGDLADNVRRVAEEALKTL